MARPVIRATTSPHIAIGSVGEMHTPATGRQANNTPVAERWRFTSLNCCFPSRNAWSTVVIVRSGNVSTMMRAANVVSSTFGGDTLSQLGTLGAQKKKATPKRLLIAMDT